MRGGEKTKRLNLQRDECQSIFTGFSSGSGGENRVLTSQIYNFLFIIFTTSLVCLCNRKRFSKSAHCDVTKCTKWYHSCFSTTSKPAEGSTALVVPAQILHDGPVSVAQSARRKTLLSLTLFDSQKSFLKQTY